MGAKIKNWIKHPHKKFVITTLIVNAILCLIVLFISIVNGSRVKELYSEQAAARWQTKKMKCSEISVFYSEAGALGPTDINSIRVKIQQKLASDDYLSSKSDVRSWMDAYSGHTFEELRKDTSTLKVNVYSVGGDFFLIHTIPLKSGSYLDMDNPDVNQIVLDEDVAWTLFGSSDIVGKKVWIGTTVFTIVGVVEGAETDLDKQAQGENYAVYVPMKAYQQKSSSAVKSAGGDTGTELSQSAGPGTRVICYEVVMPNPIENYALNAVAEAVGIEFKTDEEKEKARSILNFGEKEIVDNTARYSFFKLLGKGDEEDYVDMKTNDIVYPYWENIARYEEARQRSGLNLMLILLVVPLLSLIYLIAFLYMNRGVALIPFKALYRKLEARSEAKKYKLMEQRQQEKLEEEQREREHHMQVMAADAEAAAAQQAPPVDVQQPQPQQPEMQQPQQMEMQQPQQPQQVYDETNDQF